MEQDFEKAASLINKAKHVVIVSHRQPDGDSVGSNLALRKILTEFYGIKVISACADPLPFSLKFLPDSEHMHKSFNNFDLIISVDCSSEDQMKFKDIKTDINFDHHATNTNYGKVNVVDRNAASTTVIIYDFLQFLKVPISANIATNLLSGIYCDTGSFMHANTDARIYEIASKLMEAGANSKTIVKHMFKTKTIEQLRLWGEVLSNFKTNKKGTIVSKVTSEDFEKTKATPKDLSGVINYLNSVPNCKLSVLLAEDLKGNVQGSMRTTTDEIDASNLAVKLGGGGHKKAAGFTIPGHIVCEEIWRIED